MLLDAGPIEMDLIEAPLSEAVEWLQDKTGAAIWVDETALNELGLDSDQPVTTVDVPFQSLRDALTFLLADQIRDLDFVVRENRIVITSQEDADWMTSTRRYDLPAGVDSEAILSELTRHVSSSPRGSVDWEESGGSGVASVINLGSGNQSTLLVTQSDRGHEAVERFLELLSKTSQTEVRANPRSGMQDDFDLKKASDDIVVSEPETANIGSADEEVSVVAYDVAKVSRLLYNPPTKSAAASDEYGAEAGYDTGGGDGYGGGGLGGGYPGGGGGFGSVRRLITFEDLKQLAQQPIAASLTVTRGSQLLVRTDARNHALIRRVIDELESLLEEAGPPEVGGSTEIRTLPMTVPMDVPSTTSKEVKSTSQESTAPAKSSPAKSSQSKKSSRNKPRSKNQGGGLGGGGFNGGGFGGGGGFF